MTQHRVVIQRDDHEGWKNWIDCAATMCDELYALDDPRVNMILTKYEFRRCDYGLGLNIDWPENK